MITCSTKLLFRYPDKPVNVDPSFVDRLDKEGNWTAQRKLDGWRTLIYVDPEVRLLTRTGLPLIDKVKVPDIIIPAIQKLDLPSNTVLDAELVGPRGSHKPGLWLFDCLAWDGSWLAKRPYFERWNLLTSRAARLDSDSVRLVESVDTDFLELFNKLKQGWINQNKGHDYLYEGIVVKRWNGKLELKRNSSAKSAHMMKLKFRDIEREVN